MERSKITLRTLQQQHQSNTPITMVTAYDATFARLFDEAGADTLLVGDSLGNVIQGHDTTLPVTIDQMVYHSACVKRGTRYAHVVTDLPFGSYGASMESSIRNATRLMQEGGAESVKLEGGRELAELIHRLVAIGVPVLGHLGLTPQSVHQLGGFRVQGRGDEAAQQILEDARILEEAGAWGIVLEMVPANLAGRITREISIPTIGIGAGNATSGQVLVGYDMLGLNDGFKPKFLKRYDDLAERTRSATKAYIREVRGRAYPDDDHSF